MTTHATITTEPESLPLSETADGRRVLSELRALLRELGGVRPEPRDDADLERELGLGSLERVDLVLRLEREFGVHLADDALGRASTPRGLLSVVREAQALSAPVRPVGRAPPADLASLPPSTAAPGSARTLVEVLLARAECDPDRPHAFIADEQGNERALTYGALLRGALEVGAGLRERGIGAGARVALILPSGEDFFEAFLGALVAGAVPVPLYPPVRIDRIEEYVEREARTLRNAEPEFIVTFDLVLPAARLLRDRAPSVRQVTSVAELRRSGARAGTGVIVAPSPDSIAVIQYTSGSTGDPKGVALTHANLLANIRAADRRVGFLPGDVAVSWVPLYHVIAAVLPADVRTIAKIEIAAWPVLGRYLRQAGHVLVDRRDADRAVGAFEEARALLAKGARIIIFPEATFMRAAGLRPFKLGAFRLAIEAGVPVVPMIMRGVRHAFPDGARLPRPSRIETEIAEPIPAGEGGARGPASMKSIVALRDRATASIAARLDEPVLQSISAGPE